MGAWKGDVAAQRSGSGHAERVQELEQTEFPRPEQIASWAVLAIDTAYLHERAEHARSAAERANERLELLARISDDLATLLDPEDALKRLAEHLVPGLADYAITYACEGTMIRRVGLAHRDEGKQAFLQSLAAAGSPSFDDSAGIGAVLRSGEDALTEEVSEDVLRAARSTRTITRP